MKLRATVCLASCLMLAPLAGTAAEPAQAGPPFHGGKVTPGRIAIRDGGFLETGSAKPFHPFGVSNFRLGPIADGKQGQGTWSKDQTKDMRVPARPLALLDTSLDFVDLHLYAAKSESESIAQHLERDLASVEMPALADKARQLGKPVLTPPTSTSQASLSGREFVRGFPSLQLHSALGPAETPRETPWTSPAR